MKECSACRHCFPDEFNNCPTDGDVLVRTISGDTVIDRRYQLDLRIGQGGMGIVFKARHVFLKTPYAIKVILPDLVGNDPMLVTRFRQEAMVAARIRHRNIVNVTDFGVASGGMPYLVMDFIKGKSLQDVLAEQGRLSPERALEIMAAICAGVGAAHKEGIVHRDLKPLNIMLQDDVPYSEGVKVLDFGLAKIKSGEFLGSFVAAQTTGLMGSPFYMAPELWSDEEPDKRVDVYSLGVILFQILSGDLPFRGPSVPAIMNKHLTLQPPRLATMGLPAAIDAVVRDAMAKKREDRFPSVEDFLNDLREAVLSANSGFVRLPNQGSPDQSVTMFLPEMGSGEIETLSKRSPGGVSQEELTLPDSQERIEHEADRLRHEFEEAQRRADEARQRADEAARRRTEEEAARKQAEEEAALKLAEEEAARKRAEEEAAQRLAEEEARKRAEEEAAQRLAEEEARKRAEEEAARKRAADEAVRLAREVAEAQQRAEAARLLAEEEARRRTEEEAARLRAEEKARQLALEVEEVQRRAEEARQRAEEEAIKRAEQEEARRQVEAEKERERVATAAQRQAEEEAARKHAAEEADRLAREVAEAQQRAEEARLRAEEEARKRVIEEEARKRAEEEARRLAIEVAEAQRRADEGARKRAEQEEERLLALKAAEEQRLAAEVAEAQRRAEEEAHKRAKQEEERQLALIAAEEQRLAAEAAEAQRRVEEEARKRAKQEEERLLALKAAEEQRLAAEAAEAQRRAEEEARKRAKQEEERLLAFKAAEEQRLAAEAEAQRRAEKEARKRAKQEEKRLLALKAAKEEKLAEQVARDRAAEESRLLAELEAKRQREGAEDAAAIERERLAREEREFAQLQQTVPAISLTEPLVMPAQVETEESQTVLEASNTGGVRGAEQHTAPLPTQLLESVHPWQQSQPSIGASLPDVNLETNRKFMLPMIIGLGVALIVVVLGIALALYQWRKPSPQPAENKNQGAPETSPATNPITKEAKIEGGTFRMGRSEVPVGSTDPYDLSQSPAHSVPVKTFWMDKMEVTNEEYAEFVRATRHTPPPYWKKGVPPPGYLQLPVTEVSLNDAKKFAEWRSQRDGKKWRLPTEEEWEYAARNGAQETTYPWGNKWPGDQANVDSKALKSVGSYPEGASQWGVLDLIGNAWEWTSTKAAAYPGNTMGGPQGEFVIPQGQFVIRGGAYVDHAGGDKAITSTRRSFLAPSGRAAALGFRLVRDEP